MGEVWAAVSDTGPHHEVAIKVLLARAAMKPDLVRRFEREAKIASAIQSPYVCQILEVGQAEDGAHLLVFEHLSGESLADRLKREQYLPFSEVGPILEDVLRGLAAAHEAGVIHRDLKPGNIFLEQLPDDASYAPPSGGFGFGSQPPPARRERAKILDFGISKINRRQKEEPTLTAFDATLGSFAYMAPEQVRGAARADERADIYAIGAVAFRALSGRLPFEGATAAVLVAMKLDRSAPSLAEATGEQWPAGVERFLERALERRKELRFGSATEALAFWRSIQPSAVVVTTPTVVDTEPGTRPSPGTAPPAPAAPRPGTPPPRPEPGLAPARASTPIPMPTKPIVAPERQAPARAPEPRPAARHGTLTMDEAPVGLPRFAPEPTVKESAANSVVRTARGLGPSAMLSPAAPPAPRPPMQSYQIIEDNPTEVDGPPEMTFDGAYNPPPAPPSSEGSEGDGDDKPPRSRPRGSRKA